MLCEWRSRSSTQMTATSGCTTCRRPTGCDFLLVSIWSLNKAQGLGRPVVETIKASRHQNMKELRSGTIRVLFAFDPVRQAVLLIGGDKVGQWEAWYRRNIPVADDLYDEWLVELEKSADDGSGRRRQR
jgi:hypothetical protein